MQNEMDRKACLPLVRKKSENPVEKEFCVSPSYAQAASANAFSMSVRAISPKCGKPPKSWLPPLLRKKKWGPRLIAVPKALLDLSKARGKNVKNENGQSATKHVKDALNVFNKWLVLTCAAHRLEEDTFEFT